jgi:hypothetical protein
MMPMVTRTSLVAQFRMLLCVLFVSALWAGLALMNSVREHAALIQARAAADIVQAMILQGDTYRLQANFTHENVTSWRLIYPAQRSSNDRFELAAVAAFFGESANSTAAAAPVEKQRELYAAEDGVRLLYATRLRGPREEDMLFSLAIRMPSALTILSQTVRGATSAALLVLLVSSIGLLAWVRWGVLGSLLTVGCYARRLLKARSGAIVEAPELHPDELTSRNEVHRISIALSAVARALRLRQTEEQA